jgi:hypothetical protein
VEKGARLCLAHLSACSVCGVDEPSTRTGMIDGSAGRVGSLRFQNGDGRSNDFQSIVSSQLTTMYIYWGDSL